MIEAILESERLKRAQPKKGNVMNQEQVKSGIRWLVSTFGGVLAGYFAAWSGWFSADQIVGALNSPTFLALASSIVMGIWGIFNHSDKGLVAAVGVRAEDPASPIKGVVLTNTPEGKELEKATPNTVVVAGSPEASAIAKAA